ncbi:MAG: DUF3365 domain-containing protein [Gammaproteobacteria bacterium]|nr:DUF3365 domain-containing protein [Gammaproteobacteria bacterium]
MNLKLLPLLLGLPLLPGLQNLGAADVDMAQLQQEAMGIVKKFGGSLKPELQMAIKTGGPAHAISVCSEKAPSIAQSLSSETGWTVKRVSLKARSETAVPDAWEKKALEEFDQRQANGESAAKMAYQEVVDGSFRFIKAQAVEAVCLGCHAAEIKSEVEAALEQEYPNDKARGYTLGQIRGAFSLSRDL